MLKEAEGVYVLPSIVYFSFCRLRIKCTATKNMMLIK